MGLIVCLSGCQQLPIVAMLGASQAVQTASSATTAQEMADEQEGREQIDAQWLKSLQTDHWIAAAQWPEPLAGPQAVLKLKKQFPARWQLTSFRSSQPDPAKLWNEKQREELRLVSQAEDLAGWNACILLAQSVQAPLETRVLQQLERLTVSPPKYDSETGRSLAEIERLKKETERTAEEEPDSRKSISWIPHFLSPGRIDSGKNSQYESESVPEKQQPEKQIGKPISESMRAAAAEAWCLQLSRLEGSVEQNFAKAGWLLEDGNGTLPVVVRAELLRGVARSVRPRLIPGLDDQLTDSQLQLPEPAPLTLAALDACLIYALTHPQGTAVMGSASGDKTNLTFQPADLDPDHLWPHNLWQCRWLETPDMVNRFGLWLALTQHPLAEGYLKQRLNHLESAVQMQAIRNLGLLPPESVQTLLTELISQRQGPNRAAALLAAGVSQPEVVFRAQQDESAVVRTVVAQFAGRQPSLTAARTLEQLAADVDPQVQKQALAAVADWENALAFPILAVGFQSANAPVRNEARKLLEQRFGVVIASIEDAPAQRAQLLETIRQQHQLPSEQWLTASEEQAAEPTQTPQALSEVPEAKEILQELRLLADLNIVQSLDPQVREKRIQALQQVAAQAPLVRDQALGQMPVAELQASLSQWAEWSWAGCREMHELRSEDVLRRRGAARKIAEEATQKTLPEWKLRLLAERLREEQDLQVCREIFKAIAADTTPSARQIVEVALAHTWSDVRILGCRYVQTHRLPQLAPFLLPLMQERNPTVQNAAITAAGYCRNPIVIQGFKDSGSRSETGVLSGSQGLKALLGGGNRSTELLVITALARLGDEQGLAELRKLSYSHDPEVRRQAVERLSDLEDPEVAFHLIRLGWTEQNLMVQKAILQGLQQLVPAEEQPEVSASQRYEEQLEIWSRWAEAGQSPESR